MMKCPEYDGEDDWIDRYLVYRVEFLWKAIQKSRAQGTDTNTLRARLDEMRLMAKRIEQGEKRDD